MLVSVVVPSFNHERYVLGALGSVSAQDYPDIELIVVDDASEDGTADRVAAALGNASYRRRFVRTELIRHPKNSGAHAALNDGLAAARGDVLAVLNSDDAYAPGRVSRLLHEMERGKPAFAFSGVVPIDALGAECWDSDLARSIARDPRRVLDSLPSVGFGFLGRQWAISTGNFFFSRELYEDIGGFVELEYCHDWDFVLRATTVTEPRFVPEPLYYYRIHGANSFRDLHAVAEVETEAVLKRYFLRVLQTDPQNPIAPTPTNWPGLFEEMLDSLAIRRHWQELANVRPRYAERLR